MNALLIPSGIVKCLFTKSFPVFEFARSMLQGKLRASDEKVCFVFLVKIHGISIHFNSLYLSKRNMMSFLKYNWKNGGFKNCSIICSSGFFQRNFSVSPSESRQAITASLFDMNSS